jgi:SOS-response transcriptional repressor LexA
MEPLIPANSVCLFRRTVAGTRQNRVVLVRRIDETGSAGEVTIKRYRSDKVVTEEGFQHTRITMVPENPEYPRWTLEPGEQLDVIGEFVQVLGPADE